MSRHWVAAFVLGLLASPAALAQAPVISPPVNAASFTSQLSPGVTAIILGQNLSASPNPAARLRCPGAPISHGLAALQCDGAHQRRSGSDKLQQRYHH